MDADLADAVFRALDDERRRLAVRYLMEETDGTATCREVAEHVRSNSVDPPADAALALRHALLPRLEEAGLVEYDPEGGRIRYRSCEFVEDVLTVVEDERPTGTP
ncbi:DUF7344 domain-containing protein [Haloplanus pelagicus]|jgi:DNA-binding transcriptional ArsR family regulator|uniref:DUF7344 domain-containing protein n=1 Tax=Haloplanus pelagicus TaxID=2949995 RepID=UPI00203B3D53|nr:hypothetical protein [Haloplanus sp. HW8-1]